ncbi:MAG: hypothetical protein ACTFAK_14190 [Candidatus Electronema sp. VV]
MFASPVEVEQFLQSGELGAASAGSLDFDHRLGLVQGQDAISNQVRAAGGEGLPPPRRWPVMSSSTVKAMRSMFLEVLDDQASALALHRLKVGVSH